MTSMRHATVNAIRVCLGLPTTTAMHGFPDFVRACDWKREPGRDLFRAFTGADAAVLSGGARWGSGRVVPPSCPFCADFVDLALSIRAEERQQEINAEIDAEGG